MKITASKIRRLIREELSHIIEQNVQAAEFEEPLELRAITWEDLHPETPSRNPESKTTRGHWDSGELKGEYTVDVIELKDGQKVTMGTTSEIGDFMHANETQFWVAAIGEAGDCIIGPDTDLRLAYEAESGISVGPTMQRGDIRVQTQLYLVPIGSGGYYVLGSEGGSWGIENDGMPHVVWDDGNFDVKLPTRLGPSGVWVKRARTDWGALSVIWVLDKRHIKPECMPNISGAEIVSIERSLRRPDPPPPPPDWLTPNPIELEPGESDRYIYAIHDGVKIPVISLERYQALEDSTDYEDQDLADMIADWRDGQITDSSAKEDILTRISVRFPPPGEYYMPDDLQDDWRTSPIFTDDDMEVFDDEDK
tara:strand:- start:1081 stop:2178 length:1098 start_codon:yes stop_codon:yes gene_type:complete